MPCSRSSYYLINIPKLFIRCLSNFSQTRDDFKFLVEPLTARVKPDGTFEQALGFIEFAIFL
jgi:hypothetical protein